MFALCWVGPPERFLVDNKQLKFGELQPAAECRHFSLGLRKLQCRDPLVPAGRCPLSLAMDIYWWFHAQITEQ